MTPSQAASVPVSVVIPTRARPDYLEVALASIAPQAAQAGAEVVVVDDAGASAQARSLCERFGARYEPHPRPLGLNAARNTGVQRSRGELVAFVDDDVEVDGGWLAALVDGAAAHPQAEVFTGPIVPRLEGHPPRSCGREGPPVTSLQLGPRDCPTRYAWGANMAIRRGALERIGAFDTSLHNAGDEQEWQDRLHAAGGSVVYLADAGLVHRRSPEDARLRSLCRAAYYRGAAARRFDAWQGRAPSLGRELLTLAGCVGHVVRRRCPAGWVMAAHSAGRLRAAVGEAAPAAGGTAGGGMSLGKTPSNGMQSGIRSGIQSGMAGGAVFGGESPAPAPADDFLSGESGTVAGKARAARVTFDAAMDALQVLSGQRLLLARAAARQPPRRSVLVIGVERPERHALAQAMRAELVRSRHDVELRLAAPADRGKFENLNLLLGSDGHDWLLVVDDDVVLPRGFLDRFLFLAERYRFDLAQPAHAHASHAAWAVTRRRAVSAARQTRFVEIGPVTAFARATFSKLLPFPQLRMGWGLDAHWAALASEQGWRCGVIDALPVRHTAAPAASAYSREQALAEARAFLAGRPYLPATELQRTLATHYRW